MTVPVSVRRSEMALLTALHRPRSASAFVRAGEENPPQGNCKKIGNQIPNNLTDCCGCIVEQIDCAVATRVDRRCRLGRLNKWIELNEND